MASVETADVVLMRSDPLDVVTAITISLGTKRKMHQNLAWTVGSVVPRSSSCRVTEAKRVVKSYYQSDK